MSKRRPYRLVWHRRDLRLDDNELYRDLQQRQQQVVSLFVINPDEFHPRAAVDNNNNNLCSVTRGPHASRLLVLEGSKLGFYYSLFNLCNS